MHFERFTPQKSLNYIIYLATYRDQNSPTDSAEEAKNLNLARDLHRLSFTGTLHRLQAVLPVVLSQPKTIATLFARMPRS